MSTKNDRLTDNPSASYIVHCTLTSSNDLKNINAIALAAWEIGKETEAAQWVSDLWKNLHNSDVWQRWPLIIGLFEA